MTTSFFSSFYSSLISLYFLCFLFIYFYFGGAAPFFLSSSGGHYHKLSLCFFFLFHLAGGELSTFSCCTFAGSESIGKKFLCAVDVFGELLGRKGQLLEQDSGIETIGT
jgi:hypothetical protein